MKGEFGFIAGIREMFPSPDGVLGIGDDCAVIPQNQGYDTLVSTDMLVEGSHFLLDDISSYQLGWKSAASNFSDIAAMGGEAVGSFLSIALPHDLPQGWTDGFLEGYRDISSRYGFPLLGGDTTSGEKLCISITVLGRMPGGKCIKRSGARVGDLVCVTGTLGDSAAGLDAILKRLERTEDVRYLIERHYLPHPRLDEGRSLALTPGVHAMMDISDGIASDLRHIMEESGTGAEVDLRSLPVSDKMLDYCGRWGIDPYEFAAGGGEDYELLFTISPDAESALAVPHTVIGRITEGNSLIWKGSDRSYEGFRHF